MQKVIFLPKTNTTIKTRTRHAMKSIYILILLSLLPIVSFSQLGGGLPPPNACIDDASGGTWYWVDLDRDGFGGTTGICLTGPTVGYTKQGGDCNDNNASVYPKRWYLDADGDGHGNPALYLLRCIQPSGYVSNNNDCNDNDSNITVARTWYRDVDGDGYGVNSTSFSCTQPSGYANRSGDCNDNNANVNPGRSEGCSADGVDNNCAGGIDEGIPGLPRATVSNQCGKSILYQEVHPIDGDTWYWQSSSGGTSTSNSSNNITRTSGNRYYLRSRNNSSGCWSAAITVNYSIKAVPGQPAAPSVSNNCGNSVLTRSNPPSGVTWYWQSSSGGTSISNANASITITSGSTYYLRARNNSTGCWSTSRSVGYSIKAVPGQPAAPSVTNNCGNSVLTRSNPPSGITWYWQSSSGGTSISNANASITRTSGSTYYIRARNNNTGCWSTSRSVNYSIKAVPGQPTAPSVTNNCGNSVLTRSNPPSGITWYWQSSSGGTSISNANASITRTSGSTYYIRARNNSTGCWSTSRSVNYSIKAIPGQPTAPSVTNNCGNTVLTRGNPPSGITWYWQSSSGGTSTSNANASITRTTGSIYYIRARNNSTSCWSTSRSVSYSINPLLDWYLDIDGDGFATSKVTQCTSPGNGYVQTVLPLTDCNDNNAAIHPGTIWYADIDTDGFGDSGTTKIQCTQPTGYVLNKGDQCVSIHGAIHGCEDQLYQQTTLSDTENYVFTQSFQKAMTSRAGIQKEADVIESVAYYDGLGRSKQQVAIKASPKSSTLGVANELTMDWTSGQGGTAFFNQNGRASENHRELGVHPGGKLSLLWQCANDVDRNADGGWNTDYFNVDKNVGYRYTVWVKRTGSNNGTTYHGTQNVNDLNGNALGNPYFWYGDLPNLDTWYLLVGVIHPDNYTGGDQGISGVYDLNGNRVIDGTEFKWMSTTTNSRFRSYLYYSTDVNTNQFFWNPVVQKLDGNETPLSKLVSGSQGKINDIVTHIEYDEYGRQAKQHLPFKRQNTPLGSFKPVDIHTDINSYYQSRYADDFTGMAVGEINAYSESIFEASPLNRVVELGAPGKDWKANPNSDTDHTIKFDWGTNTTGEVAFFEVIFENNNPEKPTLTKRNEDYPAGELYVTITKDENWTATDGNNRTTKEYKDKQGRVILKRTYASTGSASSVEHDTYYVYDSYGNLTYVLPPKVTTGDGVSNSELVELCYQYIYDYRNRLVEKKIPGKGWEYIVYNKLDQPVMTQDAMQRTKNEWLFTKYDALGRVAFTGLHVNPSVTSRTAMQDGATHNSNYTQYVSRTSSSTLAGTEIYYTNGAIPHGITEIYTINYYDDYEFNHPGISAPATALGQTIDVNAKGLPTGSKVRVLGTNDWITTATFYDQKARAIYVASINNYLNTNDVIETELDFVGKVKQTKTTHIKGSNAAIVTIDKFEYDHMGRMMKQTQKINTQDEELIASNAYDELGQLIFKKVGGTATTLSGNNGTLSGAEGLQDVDYTYNVRGWLKGINDVSNIGNDLFTFGIDYNAGASPLYNGNISSTSWQTANDNVTRNYAYTYDALNRITSGLSNEHHYNLSYVTYDKAGNIMTLKRHGWQNSTNYWDMDILSYSYNDGNKLLKVADGGNKTYGFKDGTNTNNDFDYDTNGNMTIDRNKGITGITYNHLNLPTTVTISNTEGTGNISYIYDAAGAKLKKIVTEGSSLTTEYAGNYVYKNGTLEFFNHAEGYVEKEADGYKYVYQYKDHLGNVRLSYKDANKDGSISQSEIIQEKNYYPFGLTHKGYNDILRGRNHTYGFGSKEEQDEIGLEWLDFGFRNYDSSLGRWMNIDNLAENYFNYSPYTYTANNPIYYIDPDGQQIIIHYQDEDGKDQQHTYEYGGTYDGDNQFIKDVYSSLSYIIDNDADTTGLIERLSGDELGDVGILQNTKDNNPLIENSRYQTYFNSKTNEIIYDPEVGIKREQTSIISWLMGDGYSQEGVLTPAEGLLHELGHAESSLEDPDQHEEDSNTDFTGGWDNKEEFDVINKIERPAAKKLNHIQRDAHRGKVIRVVSPTSIIPKKKK